MIDVIPITLTQVDWPSYLRTSMEILQRSPSKHLDAANIPIKTPFSFIASLDCFKGGNLAPNYAVRDAGFSLRHFSFGVLILCDRYAFADLVTNSDLAVTFGYSEMGNHYLYLVTGTLFQWQQTIIANLSQKTNDPELREVLNRVVQLLEQAGLVDLFRGFRKTSQSDGTFLLEA